MSESNYHGRMMNIAVVLRQMLGTTTNQYLSDVETYKLGHRDARHAAAEIAAEADARIASLETQLAAAQERERAVVELMRTIFHPDHWHNSVGAMVVAVHAALAAAQKGSDV